MKRLSFKVMMLFSICMTLLYTSCKKNSDQALPETVQNAKKEIPAGTFKIPDSYKKEINGRGMNGEAISLIISGADEQTVNSAAVRIHIGTTDDLLKTQQQAASRVPDNFSLSTGDAAFDPEKCVYVSIKSGSGITNGFSSELPFAISGVVGAAFTPIAFWSDLDANNPLKLRRNTIKSFSDFGSSGHGKVIGFSLQPFGNPYGSTGYPLRSSVTSQSGVYCNRLITYINQISVSPQSFTLQTESW